MTQYTMCLDVYTIATRVCVCVCVCVCACFVLLQSSIATAGHTSNMSKSQVTLYWRPPSEPVDVTLW